MKKQFDIKKLVLLNLPYLLMGLFATNFGEAWRLAQGANASEKFLSLFAVLPGALQSFWPSLHPLDLLVQAYMGDKADMNKANEVRPIFRRLAEVAERTGCAVILIGHLNKAAGGQSAYRGLGSIDFRAAARSVLLIGRVKREPNVRVIIHDKSSLAPEGKPVAFCLDPETGFEWIGEYDITADELLSGAGGNNATKTEQAEKLILDLLADGKELASEDIEKAAADAGISARTVRAAKKNLDGRITSKRIGAAWYHALKK